MRMIIEERPPFQKKFSHRILYAGNDLMLTQFLKDTLADCQTVRCPNGSHARLFIEQIRYSLLLFDEHLPDTTGAKLQSFTWKLAHRKHTPVIIFKASANYETLARNIKRLLAAK